METIQKAATLIEDEIQEIEGKLDAAIAEFEEQLAPLREARVALQRVNGASPTPSPRPKPQPKAEAVETAKSKPEPPAKPKHGGSRRKVPTEAIETMALDAIKMDGSITPSQLAKLAKTSPTRAATILLGMKGLERDAYKGGWRYRMAATGQARPGGGQKIKGQGATLSGRVLSKLQIERLSLPGICLALEDEDPEALRKVVNKLMADGDVRTNRVAGVTVYAGVP